MKNKSLQDLYQKLVQETVDFCNDQKLVYVEDLIKVSSSVVCFSVDLLLNNTDLTRDEVETVLSDALKISLSSEEDLEFELAEEGTQAVKSEASTTEDKKSFSLNYSHLTKNNKLLN